MKTIVTIAATGLLSFATAASAQDDSGSSNAADLAKQLSNPIASLISVPFQFNYNDYSTGGGDQFYLNIQPVIPISISDDWNLITRAIFPLYHQDVSPIEGKQIGTGSTLASFFLSPKDPGPGGLIWGAGPVVLIPTATDNLGTPQWGLGPTVVALKQSGGWTYGGLANQIWSINGNDEYGETSELFLQPFVSYTTKGSTTIALNTETTYDWIEDEWSVPLNLMLSQMVKLGDQHLQLQAGARYWAVAPDDGPEGWGARLTVTFLFPKK